MRYLRSVVRLGAVLTMLLAGALPALAQGTSTSQTLVIGVDHADPANQQPEQHRVFEYTDFFTRAVTVHTGDTLDFRTAPNTFHVVGLGPSDAAARAAYPTVGSDTEDPVKAIGTGLPKITQGPGQQQIVGGSAHGGGTVSRPGSGPPTCGVAQLNQQPCTFQGGDDVEDAGGIAGFNRQTNQAVAVDWKITINAPPGAYTYLCWIHPGMTGTVTVVDPALPTTTQAQVDSQAATQFAAEQTQALAVEQAANTPRFTGGAPGSRTYQVYAGTATPDGYVNITEMLPRSLSLVTGDRVDYRWQSPNDAHTVGFASDEMLLNSPDGVDCGTTYQDLPHGPPQAGAPPFRPCLEPGARAPEVIGDPGTTPSGSALTDPSRILDSGFLIGTGFGLTPSSQQWSIITNGSTRAGSYTYFCSLHDGMAGTLTVSAAAGAAVSSPAQTPAQIPAQMPSTGAGGGAAPLFGGLALLGLLALGIGASQFRPRCNRR